jgi:hypothetical protein
VCEELGGCHIEAGLEPLDGPSCNISVGYVTTYCELCYVRNPANKINTVHDSLSQSYQLYCTKIKMAALTVRLKDVCPTVLHIMLQ